MADQCEHYTDGATASESLTFRWVYALTDAATGADALAMSGKVVLSDGATADDALSCAGRAAIIDGATAGDVLTPHMALTRQYSDGATGSDAFLPRSRATATDEATGGDSVTWSWRYGISLTDGARASETLTPHMRLVCAVTDAATASEVFLPRSRGIYTDGATGNDALSRRMKLRKAYADGATASDTFSYTLRFRGNYADAARGSDALAWSTALQLSLYDQAYADDQLRTSEDAIDGAWTASTDLLAISQYSNTPANSSCSAFGLLLLGTDAGIVAMTGATDQGAALTSQAFSTGLLDTADLAANKYGRPIEQWRMEGVYLALTGESGLLVSVGNTQEGSEEVTYDYTVPARAAAVPVTTRCKFGRGLRNRYYRITVTTEDGVPFAIHDMTPIALQTSRRL
jgi:hypothetical protein